MNFESLLDALQWPAMVVTVANHIAVGAIVAAAIS